MYNMSGSSYGTVLVKLKQHFFLNAFVYTVPQNPYDQIKTGNTGGAQAFSHKHRGYKFK